MKRQVVLGLVSGMLLVMMAVTSCSTVPSESAVQTAIALTQTAMPTLTPTSTPTATPKPTATNTPSPTPTRTPRPTPTPDAQSIMDSLNYYLDVLGKPIEVVDVVYTSSTEGERTVLQISAKWTEEEYYPPMPYTVIAVLAGVMLRKDQVQIADTVKSLHVVSYNSEMKLKSLVEGDWSDIVDFVDGRITVEQLVLRLESFP